MAGTHRTRASAYLCQTTAVVAVEHMPDDLFELLVLALYHELGDLAIAPLEHTRSFSAIHAARITSEGVWRRHCNANAQAAVPRVLHRIGSS